MRTSVPGVATGLAWTPAGGDILFVEATSVAGKGKLILTGQLGDVMKESAQAALTLVKSRAAEFGIDTIALQKFDVHVHVPAGAIPKDGPSAGVAMFMALTSLLTGRTVRSDTAMTGEISLRGLVLPIGGVKEKVLAAIQAGIATVMLPARNRKDIARCCRLLPRLSSIISPPLEGDRLGQGPGLGLDRRHHRRRRGLGRRHRHHLCRRPFAGKDRQKHQHHLEPQMSARRSPNERVAVLEQRVIRVETELARMSVKVDEMHAVLMQAKGVRWAIVAVAGVVGFVTGISQWIISKA